MGSASVAGRVWGVCCQDHWKQAALGVNHHHKAEEFNPCAALSLLKPTLATPLLRWTLHTQVKFRHRIAAGLQSPPTSSLWRMLGLPHGERGAKSLRFSSHTFRFPPRRSVRDSGISVLEDAAAVEDSQVREASVAARSLIFKWRLVLSLFTNLVLCGLLWLDGVCTRGQECMKPKLNRLRMRTEPLRYWAQMTCLLLCWLSVAFFLHWQVQRWELSTMVIADRQGTVADGAFDPGGGSLVCHSYTGLGCQISFIPISRISL